MSSAIPMTPAEFKARLAELDRLTLKHGSHGSFRQGVCAMEAVAYIAGEQHSDRPECACPVIAAFMRRLNDGLPDDESRTRLLRPLLPRLVGSRSTEDVERRRGWLAVDWAYRVAAPAFLELHPELATHAQRIRESAPVTDEASAASARAMAYEARRVALNVRAQERERLRAAYAAAAYAAEAAAAAYDVAYAAADAAYAAAYAAADAAYAAADAAYAAADAACAAAYAAAYAAADVYAAVRKAAREAAETKLRPVADQLQRSAVDLVERMIAVVPEAA